MSKYIVLYSTCTVKPLGSLWPSVVGVHTLPHTLTPPSNQLDNYHHSNLNTEELSTWQYSYRLHVAICHIVCMLSLAL